MKSLKDILAECKKRGYKIGDYCEGLLIEQGYIKNDCFGWEKLEVLERFGLDPNMKAIPSKLIDEVDYKETKKSETDSFGNKTGEFRIERMSFKTGKKILVASDEWLNYMRFKREQNNQELIAQQIYETIT